MERLKSTITSRAGEKGDWLPAPPVVTSRAAATVVGVAANRRQRGTAVAIAAAAEASVVFVSVRPSIFLVSLRFAAGESTTLGSLVFFRREALRRLPPLFPASQSRRRWMASSFRRIARSCISFTNVQDNVFVQMHCSIQYRVIKENADDAFYELQNPMEQIIQLMYLMSFEPMFPK
nr:protein PPLZ12 [Ipomoea trifida]